MTPTTICLFRHGETEWNTEGRYQGHMNSPLTSRGKTQARENARIFQKSPSLPSPFTVYASPLGRVKETALIMLDELGMPADVISYDDRLMEASFGDCEGFTEAEVAQKYPEFWKKRLTDCWNARPPFGESYADLSSRVCRLVQRCEVLWNNDCHMSCDDLTGFAWHVHGCSSSRNC